MGVKLQEGIINHNLISLKVVLFLFYGGLAAIYPVLTPHMINIGLNYNEARAILIVAPLISLIGPLIVGPLMDRIAARKQATAGTYLRYIGGLFMILTVILYSLLLIVPSVSRSPARRSLVSFGCDLDGAIIFQERCSEEKTCFHWKTEQMGSLVLANCSYTCQNPTQFESLYNPWSKGSPAPPTETSKERSEDYDYEDPSLTEYGSNDRDKRDIEQVFVEPPHLCTKKRNDDGEEVLDRCHVYTEDSKHLTVHATLRSATNQENDTHSAEWCNYPLDGFQCNIPHQQAEWMKLYMNTSHCKPMVECEVHEPYDSPKSVLAQSLCIKVIGDPDVTFWSYIVIRSLADLFAAAVITILNTAIIIATRETSTGRGDVGRQLAFGSLGWALISLILGFLPINIGDILVPIIVFDVFVFVAAITLILAKNMPVSPPEWWWHTKSGMLAIPLSAIRKYVPEIVAICVVAIVLGVFWSVIDTYEPWHLYGLNSVDGWTVIPFTLTICALPAMIPLWYSEWFVDYCGHSNILMAAFTVYILRYTGLALMDEPWWALLMAAMEPVTLAITWVTLILYMRHLVSRRLTATGQAFPVIAFFGIGKSIGAALGFIHSESNIESIQCLYVGMAIAACIIALLYFLLYHCLLAPRCAARMQPPPPTSELQVHTNGSGNQGTNGTYTPLRVYHNARGIKGEFRY